MVGVAARRVARALEGPVVLMSFLRERTEGMARGAETRAKEAMEDGEDMERMAMLVCIREPAEPFPEAAAEEEGPGGAGAVPGDKGGPVAVGAAAAAAAAAALPGSVEMVERRAMEGKPVGEDSAAAEAEEAMGVAAAGQWNFMCMEKSPHRPDYWPREDRVNEGAGEELENLIVERERKDSPALRGIREMARVGTEAVAARGETAQAEDMAPTAFPAGMGAEAREGRSNWWPPYLSPRDASWMSTARDGAPWEGSFLETARVFHFPVLPAGPRSRP